MSEAYIGLGSNLGNRGFNICRAVMGLQEISSVVSISSLYETMPVGFSEQPPYLNAACRIWTRGTAFELLSNLKSIEKEIGYKRAFINGPRVIDLDILIFEKMVIESPSLTLPHPRMADREFVLKPMAEIAIGLMHPILKQTIKSLGKRSGVGNEVISAPFPVSCKGITTGANSKTRYQ